MLRHLDIRNIVLIEQIGLDFGPGLSVLTGETGAGKSILLDAVGLLRGDRADVGLIRKGAENASVSARFDMPQNHPVIALLHDQGIVTDDELVLRRVLSTDGKSRAFINDQPVTLNLIKQIGQMLIDLHGQFDNGDLFNPDFHRSWIDDFGDHKKLLSEVRGAWTALNIARKNLASAQENALAAAREEDYLRDAVAALVKLAPERGEEEKLSARKAMLNARGAVIEHLTATIEYLQGDGGAAEKLALASRAIDRLRSKMGDTAVAWLAQMDNAMGPLNDLITTLEATLYQANEGDENLEAIEDRLYDLRGVGRRYGCTPDQLPDKLNELQSQLELIDGGTDVITKLAGEVQAAERVYLQAAGALSKKRRDAAKSFDALVMKELPPLKLEKARFMTAIIARDPAQYGPDGIDGVRFLVATNPGTDPAPLEKIASGGELSRLMLALKVVLATAADTHLVMIFDEVDSGIGGAVAAAVAERLSRLAQSRQVLAVTHAPQVAARADHHLIIVKQAKAKTAITSVSVLVNDNDRREEIARMLSGEQVTDEARAAAQKLLEARVA